MSNERIYLKCDICGNIVGMIEDSGVKLYCCGQEMSRLVPSTRETSGEKHVPVATRSGDKLDVAVASRVHPMTAEHYISWIASAQGNTTQHVAMEHPGEPSVVFCVGKGPITVYSYCNLHGLWAVDVQ